MARIAPLNIDWKPDRTTGEPVTEQIVGYMCEQVHSMERARESSATRGR